MAEALTREQVIGRHRALVVRLARALAVLVPLLAVSCLVSLAVGAEHIPLGQVLHSLLARVTGRESGLPWNTDYILWQVRLSRVVLGALVGMALAVAGGTFQGLLMNPLADPYLIGVSAGAGAGAAFALMRHLDSWAGGLGVPAFAFLGAVLTVTAVYALSQVRGKVSVEGFILAGVVVGSFMWGLVTIFMSIAGQDLGTIVYWLMGRLYVGEWRQVGLVALLAVPSAGAIYLSAYQLNVLTLGEEAARQSGVEVERLKVRIIALGSLLTAAAVCLTGIIGFVGLVIPHIARRLVGPDHRVLLPAAGLIGAGFLVLADTVARSAFAVGELPVGVITSLLGAPFFCYLLRTRARG